MQNLTPLALSLAEKSVSEHMHTKRTNSELYIHTLPIDMCGELSVKLKLHIQCTHTLIV